MELMRGGIISLEREWMGEVPPKKRRAVRCKPLTVLLWHTAQKILLAILFCRTYCSVNDR